MEDILLENISDDQSDGNQNANHTKQYKKPRKLTERIVMQDMTNKSETNAELKTKFRRSVSIEDKINIISDFQNGTKNWQLCKKYNLTHSTISGIIKKQDSTEKNFENLKAVQGNTNVKKYLKVEESPFERTIYDWFCQKRAVGEPISGVLLKEKAKYFHEQIYGNTEKFIASDGWLANFKKRHGLRHLQVKGEKMSADVESSAAFVDAFHKFLEEQEYDLNNVYNGDETGLQYRSLPQKTLALSSEKEVPGHKPIKDRITVMVCANATGTHQIPLLAIGKSAKPRCFKSAREVPIEYIGQKKAWMDRVVFLHWFKNIFLQNVKQRSPNSKFILLLDNAPSHPSADELNMVDESCLVMYLPPNVTSLIQPMDQGVICAMKKYYRTGFLRELLSENHETNLSVVQFIKKWTLLDCLIVLREAWTNVKRTTLSNAWKKIMPNVQINPVEMPSNVNIVELVNKIPGASITSSNDVERWLEEDHDLETCALLSDETLLNKHAGLDLEVTEKPESDDETLNDDFVDNLFERSTLNREDTTTKSMLISANHLLNWSRHKTEFTDEERTIFIKARDILLASTLEISHDLSA